MSKEFSREEILSKLQAYHDGELSPDDTLEIEKIIESDSSLKIELDRLAAVDKNFNAMEFHTPDQAFWDSQKESIMSQLTSEDTHQGDLHGKVKPLLQHGANHLHGRKAFASIAGIAIAASVVFALVIQSNFLNDASVTVQKIKPAISANIPADNNSEQPAESVTTSDQDKTTTRSQQESPQTRDEKNNTVESAAQILANAKNPTVDDKSDDIKEKIILPDETEVTREKETGVTLSTGKERLNVSSTLVDDFRNRGANSNTTFNAQKSIKLPDNVEEEFQAYLLNKSVILELESLLEQKAGWTYFLENVEGKLVSDLVVSDIYDIYYKLVYPDSDPGLKKEALDFVVAQDSSLTLRLGEKGYLESLYYFTQIQK